MKSLTRRRPSVASTGPNPVDVLVGSRIKLRRHMLGLSQSQLGEALHLTFQQIQKYERGSNRLGASRLYQVAKQLDVPLAFFFDVTAPVRAPATPAGFAEPVGCADQDPLKAEETIELVDAFHRIRDPDRRRKLVELAQALSRSSTASSPNPSPARRGPAARRQ